MVFGNMGDDSATGVAMTRSGNTGDPEIEGDYLTNAQGEDVVAGIRNTKQIAQLKQEMPEVYRQFADIAKKLEKHYRNMQDVEFTIERGKLWMLQTRDGKRTAQAEVRIAVDMVEEGLISKEEAVGRVKPEQIDFYLHPQFDAKARKAAAEDCLRPERLARRGRRPDRLYRRPGGEVGQAGEEAGHHGPPGDQARRTCTACWRPTAS